MQRLRFLWQHHRRLLLAFCAIVSVFTVFAVRTTTSAIYWMDPAHRDQTLEGWMTPRYVAMSYQLPPEVLGPALFLEKDAPPRRQSLAEIAMAHDISIQDLQVRIDTAVAAWRADHPAPNE
jgi:hypothetical protein